MITELPESNGAIVGFRISGKVDLEEEKKWINRANALVAEHPKIRVLCILEDGARWGIDAGLEDLKWISTHVKNFEKIAVVSDSTVWKWLISVDSVLAKPFGIPEKFFEMSELSDAWKWLQEE
jgi:hypothetical protein